MSVRQGSEYEHKALAYLQRQGLTLRDRNYRCKLGELDLVMQDGNTIVCVEVKFRKRSDYGSAIYSVSPAKMAKLIRTFSRYLLECRLNPAHVSQRIDVICINGSNLQWLKNVTL